MEWVETTGKTLEEAREAALDQLGVDEIDAEFEVLEQPRAGLFGRVRGEARVRARVKPTAPRAKEDRRDRRRRSKTAARETVTGDGAAGVATESAGRPNGERSRRAEGGAPKAGSPAGGSASGSGSGSGSGPGSGSGLGSGGSRSPSGSQADPNGAAGTGNGAAKRRRRRRRSGGGSADPAQVGRASAGGGAGDNGAAADQTAGRRERARPEGPPKSETSVEPNERRDGTEVEVPLQEQGRVAEDFLSGLINEFGLSADVTVTQRDEDNLDLALSGHDLGLLIGQKGATLLAVQDLTRTVVQHKTSANNGRIHVDVGGYRQKRSEALAKFANEVAAKVKQTGQRTALEPMGAADRKVVHDAITEIEGVTTISEGEEPRRRVVVLPSE